MPIQPPPNFAQDIAGRDTAIYPVIEITGLPLISTNAHAGTDVALPILLNVPSLKESIDIEKRNYKISNVNIELTNYEVEGLRFSERVSGSLINADCNIYWLSPSTTMSDAFLVYSGKIRRYDHTDVKARLIVEDRSQATLHKDLPLSNNWLTGDDVPDKYKNKPIPMVYGHVDKSPCVIKKDGYEKDGYFYNNILLQLDSDESVVLKNTDGNDPEENTLVELPNGLFTFVDDNYYIVNKTFLNNTHCLDEDGNYTNAFIGKKQYTFLKNYITILGTDELYGDISFQDFLPSTFNELEISLIDNPIAATHWTSWYYLDGQESYDLIPPSPHAINFKNITTSDIPLSLGTSDSTFATLTERTALGSVPFSGSFPIAAYYKLTFKSIPISGTSRVGFEYYPYMEIGFQHMNSGMDLDIFPEYNPDLYWHSAYREIVVNWFFISGDKIDSDEATVSEAKTYVNYNTFSNIGYNLIENVATLRYSESSVILTNSNSGGDVTSHSEEIPFSGYQDDVLESLGVGQYMNSIAIGFRTNADITLANINNVPQATYETVDITQGKLFNCYCKLHFYTPKFRNNKFYANVNGRLVNNDLSPTMPELISSIMDTELDVPNITTEGEPYYDSWKYAFSITSKINSKKLLEGLASASPYIPHFTNQGDFRFDVIKPTYGTDDEDHTILESDCIDWSFSRTDIGAVFSRIELKWNWDYARKEFGENPIEVEIVSDFSPIFNYYGLPSDHSESTLVIDDDRGKYIRDDTTAQNFAEWMLRWSCNQHLKMKIKLPLKYMDIEIGDIVNFDKILGDVKPYGINYINPDPLNGQTIYAYFMVVSTNKTLEFCEINIIQMHNLECDSVVDCAGVCGGGLLYDNCGVCGGDNTSCGECSQIYPNDPILSEGCNPPDCHATADCLGVCGGDAVYDECGICGGDNSTCVDCEGTPNGSAETVTCVDGVSVCGQENCGTCSDGCDKLQHYVGDVWHDIDSSVPGSATCNTEWGDPDVTFGTGTKRVVCNNEDTHILYDGVNQSFPAGVGVSGESLCSLCFDLYMTNMQLTLVDNNGATVEIINWNEGDDINYYFDINRHNLTDDGEIQANILNTAHNQTTVNTIQYISAELTADTASLEHITLLDDDNDPIWNDEGAPTSNYANTFIDVTTKLFKIKDFDPITTFDPFEFTVSLNISWKDANEIFWYETFNFHFTYNYCPALGNMNGDVDPTNTDASGWNVLDVVILANCVLAENCHLDCLDPDTGAGTECYGCAGDMNADGTYNVLDIIRLANCVTADNCGE